MDAPDEYPYAPSPVDRSKWAPGPWDDDRSDAETWLDPVTGYRCAAIRHDHFGHWCGYVRVPEDHPLHSKAYNEKTPIPKGWMEREIKIGEDIGAIDLFCAAGEGDPSTATEYRLGLLLLCHGGVTFSSRGWHGFDCGHAGDAAPGATVHPGDLYLDIGYVRDHVTRLALQIRDYEIAPKVETTP